MRIYISGPITGIDNYKEIFREAEERTAASGHDVINPAELNDVLPDLEYEEFMRLDFALLDLCDAILMLDGWVNSKGATREYYYAKAKGIRVIFDEFNK